MASVHGDDLRSIKCTFYGGEFCVLYGLKKMKFRVLDPKHSFTAADAFFFSLCIFSLDKTK